MASTTTPTLHEDRVALVTEDDLLTPRFVEVLREIFERFDVNQDGFLNRNELKAFAEASTGKDFTEETLEVIAKLFLEKKYLPTPQLSFLGLQGMFLLQVKLNEAEVWADLERLGYDHQLESILVETADLKPLEEVEA
ncbi:hypothetical protein H9P43_006174 [Blastocladiella emersonii ATCC 22665]|nr:hypothetical protein H9P43_006174 [Blastocladiella emersonii ATCC 22665]